jgi:hypothetical protein
MRRAAVVEQLEPLIIGGLVASCATLMAEALYSARSPAENDQVRADRRDAYEYRGAGSSARTTIVHLDLDLDLDLDFEIAAEVLPFEHRWVLPRGSV